jgi:hypothetical protein
LRKAGRLLSTVVDLAGCAVEEGDRVLGNIEANNTHRGLLQNRHDDGILCVLRIVCGRGSGQRPNQLSKREKEATGNLDDYG